MRNIMKNKLTCLLCALIFTFTAIAGCGNSGEAIKEKSTDNGATVSADEQTTANNHENNEETESGEAETNGEDELTHDKNDSQNESSTIANDITTSGNDDNKQEGDSETTSLNPSNESKTNESTGNADKTTGESETTSKKQETVTTKKPEATTKKPESTTQKQTEPETTTKKPSSSTDSSNSGSQSGSTLSTAEQMAKEIVDSIITSGMSEFEKAITIHDWLTFNLDYDFTYSHYYVEETLRDRTCVCQGYALTFKMMCEMAGLSVGYVTGTGTNSSGQTESHAWNQVRIDGKWYNVDVTWDDPASPGKDKNDHSANRYDYFIISDSRIEKNHATTDSRQTCTSDYDAMTILKAAFKLGYHTDAAFVENVTDVSNAIKKFVEAGKSEFVMWYYDTSLTYDNMWTPLSTLIDGSAIYPAKCVQGYAPENGVVKYIISITPANQWNNITVVTSKEALAELINTKFAAGTTNFMVRFEPADGVIQFLQAQYSFSYTPTYYNNNKAVLLEIKPPQ